MQQYHRTLIEIKKCEEVSSLLSKDKHKLEFLFCWKIFYFMLKSQSFCSFPWLKSDFKMNTVIILIRFIPQHSPLCHWLASSPSRGRRLKKQVLGVLSPTTYQTEKKDTFSANFSLFPWKFVRQDVFPWRSSFLINQYFLVKPWVFFRGVLSAPAPEGWGGCELCSASSVVTACCCARKESQLLRQDQVLCSQAIVSSLLHIMDSFKKQHSRV